MDRSSCCVVCVCVCARVCVCLVVVVVVVVVVVPYTPQCTPQWWVVLPVVLPVYLATAIISVNKNNWWKVLFCLCLICFYYLIPKKRFVSLTPPEWASPTPRGHIPHVKNHYFRGTEWVGSCKPDDDKFGKVFYVRQRLLPLRPLFQNWCPNLSVKRGTLFSLKIMGQWQNRDTHFRKMLSGRKSALCEAMVSWAMQPWRWYKSNCLSSYFPSFLFLFLLCINHLLPLLFFMHFSFILVYVPHSPASSDFYSLLKSLFWTVSIVPVFFK
jgi:hypothetical protein